MPQIAGMAEQELSTLAVGSASAATQQETQPVDRAKGTKKKEVGGPSGPEPTRYGDWERNGRCVDF